MHNNDDDLLKGMFYNEKIRIESKLLVPIY